MQDSAQSRFGKARVLFQAPSTMIRFLHTRIRVQDLDTSIAFYEKLGYTEKERKASPEGNQLAFLELPGNDVFLELTWSEGYKTTCPEDLMHTALGVEDIIDYCDQRGKSRHRNLAFRLARKILHAAAGKWRL